MLYYSTRIYPNTEFLVSFKFLYENNNRNLNYTAEKRKISNKNSGYRCTSSSILGLIKKYNKTHIKSILKKYKEWF